MQKSPYKFLDSYSKEDRDIFFGRDKEIEELYSRVFASRILIVYGISGTGKSSLINCGLANKFNDSDWLPVTVRRGLNINQSLLDCLGRIALTDLSSGKKNTSGDETNDIVKIIRSIYLDHFKPVYLIFDQFEELFIFGNTREKDELISSIEKVIDSDLQCRLIFSVREEYLAGLTEFEKGIPSFLSNRIRIEKMTRQNALRVIEGPCQLNGITVEPGFPEKLLEKLNPDNPDVELTWLQVYLDKVFHLASQGGKDVTGITGDLLDRAGEVKDLLGSFLEEQISQLDDPELGLVILKSFVSVKGTKHQITEEGVIEYTKTLGKDIDRETVKDLIQKFIRLRILRDKDENNRYELRHDSLATKIYEKITLVEKELLEIRQLLDNAYNNYEKRSVLLNAEDINYIAPYEDKLFLSEKLQRFLNQSKREIIRTKKRRQNILIAAALIIISVLSFFTFWAFKERNNAYKQQKLAEQQENLAIMAKNRAESASKEAQESRFQAENEKKLADSSAVVAKQNEEDALLQRRLAQRQQTIAERNEKVAKQQEQIANEERLTAELEKSKAIDAEREARRLGFLSTAQNLALKSSGIEKNPELIGLLAVQAYNFNKNNKGRPEDPIIYEALNKAFLTLDSSRHSIFKGSPNEIWILRGKTNGLLLSADLDGQIRTWTPEGAVNNIYTISFKSPINFIGASSKGEKILTQHDNLDLFLWDTRSADAENLTYQELRGHNDFVRSIAFCKDEKYLATAGRDSSVIIWNLNPQSASKVNIIKTGSVVRAMTFYSTDTLIIAQENGTVILWNVRENENSALYPSNASDNEKPICLAWNDNKKILVAGCSNGSLLLFNLDKARSAQTLKYNAHTAGIDLITFNSDYSLMATSSWDKTIKFYNYHEFFELGNIVGGAEHLRNLNYRTRSLIFTGDNKLVAGLADKSIRVWETSSEKLASMICNLVKRDMTNEEWNEMVGKEIPYENTCNINP
jgi:WD40 repeat protein/type II secretory pathway component PulM